MNRGSSMQNELTDSVTLTFEPQNSTTSRISQGHDDSTINSVPSIYVSVCVSACATYVIGRHMLLPVPAATHTNDVHNLAGVQSTDTDVSSVHCYILQNK